jgi:hypothetical protein
MEDNMADTTLAHVEQLVDQLSLEEQLRLLEHLAQRLRQTAQKRQPQDLRGIWRDRFPVDFDLDAALSEIRQAWEHEWSQGSKP